MHKFISLDLQILPAEKACISAISSAALYGKGIFTTLAIYNATPFLWEKHWRRLQENAAKLDIELKNFDEDTVKTALLEMIFQNKLKRGRARLTVFDESASGIWSFRSKNKTRLLITTAAFRAIKKESLLTVSPFAVNSTSPLANIKSCNYLENILAVEEAKSRGFDEGLRLNEKGEIAAASMANMFWVKNKNIFTPSLETGCLAGTTREFLIDNFNVQEVRAGLNEIIEADEVFLTSAGIGISPASFGNARKKNHPMVSKMNKLLDFHRVKA
jgi:branched-subunit amino acid aminotransferase/4-amino-4-deoxychorismate lyase